MKSKNYDIAQTNIDKKYRKKDKIKKKKMKVSGASVKKLKEIIDKK